MNGVKKQFNISKTDCIDIGGMLGIGSYCFLASVFYSDFAERHIQLSFLNFPIFISEIALMVLFSLFLFKLWIKRNVYWWHWGWLLFLSGIVVCALLGYAQAGPLALRNAALFYYMAFALLGYSFYNQRILTHQTVIVFLFVIFMGRLFFHSEVDYYWYTYLVLAIVFLLKKYRKYSIWAIPVILFFSHIQFCFSGSRSHFIALLAALMFLAGVIIFKVVAWRIGSRLWLLSAVAVLLLVGIVFLSDRNAIKSLITPQETYRQYIYYKDIIDSKKDTYKKKSVLANVYRNNDKTRQELLAAKLMRVAALVEEQRSLNLSEYPYVRDILYPNKDEAASDVGGGEATQARVAQTEPLVAAGEEVVITEKGNVKEKYNVALVRSQQQSNMQVDTPKEMQMDKQVEKQGNKQENQQGNQQENQQGNQQENQQEAQVEQDENYRNLDVAYVNTLFRWFIWEDMYEELKAEGWKGFLGVGLGRPQRSKSLEILGWGEREWGRDGWITPHNSFFHIIYRAGLLGAMLVIGLICVLLYMTKIFIKRKDFAGILLISVLVYWSCLALFLVILELPYNAILFWSLLGMTFAYSKQAEKAS